MTTYIPHTIGKVYDVAHLRRFDLELAKTGHPLAGAFGDEVYHIIDEGDGSYLIREWRSKGWWSNHHCKHLSAALRLAPLAIKHNPRTGKDEPLHVGDVIELKGSPNYGEPWLLHIVGAGSLIGRNSIDWRWPVEVQG